MIHSVLYLDFAALRLTVDTERGKGKVPNLWSHVEPAQYKIRMYDVHLGSIHPTSVHTMSPPPCLE